MAVATTRSFVVRTARLAIIAIEILGCEQTFGLAAQERLTAAQERTDSPAVSTAIIKVYRDTCLQCHDSDGRGEVGRAALPNVPDFGDPKWQATRGDAELSRSILAGKGRSMPAMKGKLGSVDVMKMVAFVRAFQGGKQIVEDEPEDLGASEQPAAALEHAVAIKKEVTNQGGSKLYQKLCSMCHGPDGKGTGMRASLPAIPDFADIKWHEGRSDPRLIVSVLDGKGVGMPPFRDKVGREQVRDLVAFIRAFTPSYAGRTRRPQPISRFALNSLKRSLQTSEAKAGRSRRPPRQARTSTDQTLTPPIGRKVCRRQVYGSGAGSAEDGPVAGGAPAASGCRAVGAPGTPDPCQGLGPTGGGTDGADPASPFSSLIGWEYSNRFGDGPVAGVGGPTLSHLLRNMMI